MAKNEIIKKVIYDEMIEDMKTLLKASSTNIHKGKILKDYLKDFGFKYVGTGTNRLVMKHKKYPEKVFKFALDTYGVKDNLIDLVYAEQIENYVTCFECHPTGFINVCEEVNIIKTDNEIRKYYSQMKKILGRLAKDYLLCDMSLLTPRNFGWVYNKKGKKVLVLADGSDIVPLSKDVTLRCQNRIRVNKKNAEFGDCEGKLEYDVDYKYLVCKKCGKSYNPTELYKERYKEVDILKDKYYSLGFSDKEIKKLDQSIIREREAKRNKDAGLDTTEDAIAELRKKIDDTPTYPEFQQDEEPEFKPVDDDEDDLTEKPIPEPTCDMCCEDCKREKCPFDGEGDSDNEIESNKDNEDGSDDPDSYDDTEEPDPKTEPDSEEDEEGFTGATIFEGSDYTRRDLDVITDGGIRVELDEVGEEIKTIDVLIEGEIPANSNIVLNVNQLQSFGTPIQKVVPLVDLLRFVENYEPID